MSIRMLKVLFPNTKTDNLKKSMNKKVALSALNNSCIPENSEYKVTINNKGMKFQCDFLVVQSNGPALLGMPDCQRLQLLCIICDAANIYRHRRQVK